MISDLDLQVGSQRTVCFILDQSIMLPEGLLGFTSLDSKGILLQTFALVGQFNWLEYYPNTLRLWVWNNKSVTLSLSLSHQLKNVCPKVHKLISYHSQPTQPIPSLFPYISLDVPG